MSAKHRQSSKKLAAKRAALAAGAISATAGISMMGAPAQAATAPDYTQAISDYSHALDNFLVGAGALGGSAGSAWNPIASQVPLGLLPTFTAGTTQQNLTGVSGLLTALTEVLQSPVPTNIPGLPTGNTVPGLGTVPGIGPVLSGVGGQLAAVQGVLNTLGFYNTVLGAANLPLITGIPTLDSLIPGLEATRTAFTSNYSWLGMNGSTNVSNLFATLPSLTGQSLVNGIVGGLGIPNVPLLGSSVPALVSGALAPLNILSTPSVTAWLPSAGGLYDLPLGGSMGWFGAMPTLALGPVSALGIPVSTTDTVAALPIGGFGLNAPLNLFQTGFINTPGLVLPTATGVTTIGGTTIGQFNIPMLPTPGLYVNTLRSNYFGTNGFHVNTGQTALTLPGLPVPIVYSMGSYDFGTTGAGLTLPSLFGVGLIPSFQLGTAPGQTSPDGLIPASVLNALGPRLLPTQVTSLTQLLGLPDFGAQAGTLLTPLYTGLVTPVLTPISNLATDQYGPFVNGTASGALDLSRAFKSGAGQAAGVIDSVPTAPVAATPSTATLTAVSAPTTTSLDANQSGDDQSPARESGSKHSLGGGGTPVRTILDRFDRPDPQDIATDEQQGVGNGATTGNAGSGSEAKGDAKGDKDRPTPVRDFIRDIVPDKAGQPDTQKDTAEEPAQDTGDKTPVDDVA